MRRLNGETTGDETTTARRSANAGARSGRFQHVYAALDLGSNNCRLLIARPTAQGFAVIDAFSRIVRLGEGVARTGRLSPRAMRRAIDALRVCAVKMRRRGVTRARGVATEACRRAANCGTFLERVEHETGIQLDIISTAEEARLALAGCTPLLDPDMTHAIIFDIGGGSTELMWIDITGPAPSLVAWLSLPIGVVAVAERHRSAHLDRDAYRAIVEEVAELLADFDAAHGIGERIKTGRVHMLGTSGTVTTVAGFHLDLARYDRSKVDGLRLGRQVVTDVAGRLAEMDNEARAAHPCIGPGRADLVVPGCAILTAITETWPVESLSVADRGLREGLLLGLMANADRESVDRR